MKLIPLLVSRIRMGVASYNTAPPHVFMVYCSIACLYGMVINPKFITEKQSSEWEFREFKLV